jgi:hypothetical protein
MGSFSDYAEKKILDHLIGNQTLTPPATLYVALFTVTPDDTGSGTEVDPTASAYARAAVTNDNTNWPDATDTVTTKSNGTAITFPKATADWGTIVAFAIFDSAIGGSDNMLLWGAVTPNQSIPNGVTASFDIDTLVITLD